MRIDQVTTASGTLSLTSQQTPPFAKVLVTAGYSGLQGNLGHWRRDVFGSRQDRMAAGGFQQYVHCIAYI